MISLWITLNSVNFTGNFDLRVQWIDKPLSVMPSLTMPSVMCFRTTALTSSKAWGWSGTLKHRRYKLKIGVYLSDTPWPGPTPGGGGGAQIPEVGYPHSQVWWGGGTPPPGHGRGTPPPPPPQVWTLTDGQTCVKNITFPRTTYAVGNKTYQFHSIDITEMLQQIQFYWVLLHGQTYLKLIDLFIILNPVVV